jgi:tetratricopeptide (TPR) repeat protein
MRIIITILSATLLLPTTFGQDTFTKRPPPPVSAEAKLEMEAKLKEAQTQYEANPKNADAIIWLGRRLAYLGRFTDAIDTFTKGAALFPTDARFYRHRGHRRITLRQFNLAIADLKKASELVKGKPDEIEPDGQPNARNIPTSTLQFNIWYHLGLAYYLTGQNNKALDAYRECLKVSRSPDRLVSTTHWLYMTLRRLNRNDEAAKALEAITEGMDVIENAGYYNLILMYKGIVPAERLLDEALKQGESAASHSVLYGIGNWHLYNGRREQAAETFRKIVSSNQWTSFGFIAAEVDLKKL